jgi:hypothetical protein
MHESLHPDEDHQRGSGRITLLVAAMAYVPPADTLINLKLYCVMQVFDCVVCDKSYKSEKALRNHEASKKHKEQLKKMTRVMKDEDKLDPASRGEDTGLEPDLDALHV